MSMTWCSLATVRAQAIISASHTLLIQSDIYISENETLEN